MINDIAYKILNPQVHSKHPEKRCVSREFRMIWERKTEKEGHTCKLCWLSFLMATTTGSPLGVMGLILPLYTDPKPPSPIFNILLKPFVASTSSWREKALKFCSFSLYNSGILLEGNELDGLKPCSLADLLDFSPWFNSGADFDIPLDFDFPLG